MSFFCPHFDEPSEGCAKLKTECVPGRPGCVLRGKVAFAVPVEQRLASRVPHKNLEKRPGRR
ncbi:MAG TPA: hypothetical protein PKE55_12650 [Kiritimatiellia bacterium]|nr:hypothetical protein [Kiritimatiellia bacterium]